MEMNAIAIFSCVLSSTALVVSIAAFRRTGRQSLESERDRLLTLLNDDVTWAMVAQAKLDGVRITTAKFPEEITEEFRASIDRLEKQTADVATRSKALADRIRSDGLFTEADLREYRRFQEEMKPTQLAIAEQHTQILAGLHVWAERATKKARSAATTLLLP